MKKSIRVIGLCLLAAGLWFALYRDSSPQAEVSDLSISALAQSQKKSAEDAELLSRRLISSEDLPPAGTHSLFDHHVAQLGALPYPFTALLDSFRPLDRWGQGSVSLLIPDGRSLAKGHADYRYPRVLVAAQLDPVVSHSTIAPIYSGRLFLGFVEAINTIEIIAYNEAAGRFEYQLVKDYCEGCTPRISYAKRAICTACHQSGSPIFSVRPWSETNANHEVARRLASRQGVDWTEASTTQYQGVPLSTQILMPETFDELVGQASDVTLAQKVWIDGCGEDVICRRALLAQAISLLITPGDYNPADKASMNLRDLLKANWPPEGIALENDRLLNRVPKAPSMSAKWRMTVKRLWSKILHADDDLEHSAARLEAFDRLPKIPVVLDPLTRREPVNMLNSTSQEGIHAVARMFSPRDREMLISQSEAAPERLQEIIYSGGVDSLLNAAPLNRVAILQSLTVALGHAGLDYCCLDTSSLSPPIREDARQLQITRGSVLEVFQSYCFACHRGNPVRRLNFMAGDSEDEVMASIWATERIREVLDYEGSPGDIQRMPPPASEQRARLDAARANKSDDLQRMLDAMDATR